MNPHGIQRAREQMASLILEASAWLVPPSSTDAYGNPVLPATVTEASAIPCRASMEERPVDTDAQRKSSNPRWMITMASPCGIAPGDQLLLREYPGAALRLMIVEDARWRGTVNVADVLYCNEQEAAPAVSVATE